MSGPAPRLTPARPGAAPEPPPDPYDAPHAPGDAYGDPYDAPDAPPDPYGDAYDAPYAPGGLTRDAYGDPDAPPGDPYDGPDAPPGDAYGDPYDTPGPPPDPYGDPYDPDAPPRDAYGAPYGLDAPPPPAGDRPAAEGAGPADRRASGIGAKAAIAASVADQGVSALTNIVVLVVAARLSSAAGFAAFSMVYMVFTVLLGVGVSYVGQALVLERGSDRVRAACRSAAAFTALASTVVGLGMAAVCGLAAHGGTARGLAVLGLVLPVVLTQDGLRYCFSALRLPHLALAGDTVRLLVAVPALAAQPHGSGPERLVAVWGLSALPALLVAWALLRPRLRGAPRDVRRYVRRGHLGRRFVVEFGVGNATSQLAVVGLGLFAAPLAVGALRGATTLYGPMNVLFNSATAFGPPLLNRVRGAAAKVRATAALACALAAVAGLWTLVLTLLPDRAGRQLLGETWESSSALLAASGSQYAAVALGTSALLTLRVLRPKATLPIQVVFSLASVGCMLAGYRVGGVYGAAWGLCAGSALKAAALWRQIAVLRRHPAPAGEEPAGGGQAGSAVTAGSAGGPG